MRLFAALEISEDVRSGLADWWLDARPWLADDCWRDVRSHLWHVTLAFYGEVGGCEADDLAEELAECARRAPVLRLGVNGFGVFPSLLRPKVFWAGVDDLGDGGDLKHLARCCRRAGHATVRKHVAGEAPFRGHITVARWQGRGRPRAQPWRDGMPAPPGLVWQGGRLCLFQSILRPEGPQYRRLEAFACGGDNDGRFRG